ncbi:MAG: hypothetical protein KAY27_01515 [Pedobacter sp.]|nr:hypothetical protein [Pedobacter sp.]
MAVLHRKEEKIQAVLGRLPKKYSPDDFVAMFIKLYSSDWGKIKSAYIKASQDKEPGTVINMPKPDLYLKQVLDIFLNQKVAAQIEIVKEEVAEITPIVTKAVKVKAPLKKAETEKPAKVKKLKVTAEIAPVAAPLKKTRTTKKKED